MEWCPCLPVACEMHAVHAVHAVFVVERPNHGVPTSSREGQTKQLTVRTMRVVWHAQGMRRGWLSWLLIASGISVSAVVGGGC